MGMIVSPYRFASGGVTPGSFLFDGTTSGIEKFSAVVTAYPFTIAAWIKPDSSLGSTSGFSVGGVGASTARLDLVDPSASAGVNVINAQSVNAASTTSTGTGPTNWTANTWQHVAGVWGSTNNKRTAYFNGTAGTTNTSANSTDLTTYIRTVLAGRYSGGAFGNRFKGKMAYAAMWNLELSGSDITALNGGALPTTVQAANLIFYPVWSGGVVTDQIDASALSAPGVSFDSDLPF